MNRTIKIIQGDWKSLINNIHPKLDKNSIQYKEMRQCFFCGFISCMGMMETLGDYIEEFSVVIFSKWDEEIKEFKETIAIEAKEFIERN